MSRALLTALLAALTLGTVAPHLAAQDTSSAGQARRDTSGYSGGAGVDTSGQPGGFGMTDTVAADSAGTAGAVGVTDTSGMRALYPDTTYPGDAESHVPAPSAGDSGSAGARPARESTPPTSQPRDSV
jgi:hypothetical protein